MGGGGAGFKNPGLIGTPGVWADGLTRGGGPLAGADTAGMDPSKTPTAEAFRRRSQALAGAGGKLTQGPAQQAPAPALDMSADAQFARSKGYGGVAPVPGQERALGFGKVRG